MAVISGQSVAMVIFTLRWNASNFPPQKSFSVQDFGEWTLDFCHRIHNTFRIDIFLRIDVFLRTGVFLFKYEQYQKIRPSPGLTLIDRWPSENEDEESESILRPVTYSSWSLSNRRLQALQP